MIPLAVLALSPNMEACSRGSSDIEQAACWDRASAAVEPQLANAFQRALTAARTASKGSTRSSNDPWANRPPAYLLDLRKSQVAWGVYRKAECTSRANTAMGGSEARVIYPRCMIDLTIERIKQLSDFSDGLTEGH